MKKRVLFSILCLMLAVSTVGCLRIQKRETVDDSAEAVSDIASETQAVSSETPAVSDDAYKSIVCMEIERFQKSVFSFGENNGIQLSLPDSWRIVRTEKGFDLFREALPIGAISLPKDAAPAGKVVFQESNEVLSVSVTHTIERLSTSNDGFRHRYVYTYSQNGADRCLHLVTDYKELNEFACRKLYNTSEITALSSDTAIGSLRVPASLPSILIIGNSFIGSSDIGGILSEMAGHRLDVNAVSIGYLSVSRICNEYSYILDDIASGYYDIIFLCGFYSSEDNNALGTVRNACLRSGVQLVIFPAHNEIKTVINTAKGRYSDVKFLDWKGEIDALIKNGVAKASMCVNDSHQHSTPLAGYVGAHMIYRAVLGEIPPIGSYGQVSEAYARSQLGSSYLNTASIPLVEKQNIYTFE